MVLPNLSSSCDIASTIHTKAQLLRLRTKQSANTLPRSEAKCRRWRRRERARTKSRPSPRTWSSQSTKWLGICAIVSYYLTLVGVSIYAGICYIIIAKALFDGDYHLFVSPPPPKLILHKLNLILFVQFFMYSSRCCFCPHAGVLREVIEKCVAGASVVDLCELGDRRLIEETSKVYKKEKEMKKGKVNCMSSYKALFLSCLQMTLFGYVEMYVMLLCCL